MSPLPQKPMSHVLCVVAAFCISGCGATSMIGRSTRALEHTAQSMDKTRAVLQQSENAMKELSSVLGNLGEPMGRVADLNKPMQKLGTLEPAMERLGVHLDGVESRLQSLHQPLEKVAMLTAPLKDVAALGEKIDSIAEVTRNPEKVTNIAIGVVVSWFATTSLAVYMGLFVGTRKFGGKDARAIYGRLKTLIKRRRAIAKRRR